MPHVLHCTKMQSFQETPIVSGKKTMNIHEHLNLNPTYRILSLRNAPFLRVAQEEQKKEVSEEWHRKAQQMADEAYAHPTWAEDEWAWWAGATLMVISHGI